MLGGECCLLLQIGSVLVGYSHDWTVRCQQFEGENNLFVCVCVGLSSRWMVWPSFPTFSSLLSDQEHTESRISFQVGDWPWRQGWTEPQGLLLMATNLHSVSPHKAEENSLKPAHGIAYCGYQEFIMGIKLNVNTRKGSSDFWTNIKLGVSDFRLINYPSRVQVPPS